MSELCGVVRMIIITVNSYSILQYKYIFYIDFGR